MQITTITVIGANGSMGARISAIFASFGMAKVYMVCRDLDTAKKAAQNAIISVKADSISTLLVPADYSMLEKCIKKSDLIFESIAENLEAKIEINKKIANFVRPNTIICTGTSGLSITALAECFALQNRANYFGVHMFNPPYNLTLCELIPTKYSDATILNAFTEYLQNKLHRTVVKVLDSPAFLANRIGFQFINKALIYAEKYRDYGGIDYIDSILGPFSGRAMAPIETADFVGLDVHYAIVDNLYKNTSDYVHSTFLLPDFVHKLINNGKLGRKTGCGIYKFEKDDKGNITKFVYDINSGEYRLINNYVFPFSENMKVALKNGDYIEAINVLVKNSSQEAKICLSFLLEYIAYSIYLGEILTDDASSVDAVMATGFNWCPPIALLSALKQSTNTERLLLDKLSDETLSSVNIKKMFELDTKYDFRPFLRAR